MSLELNWIQSLITVEVLGWIWFLRCHLMSFYLMLRLRTRDSVKSLSVSQKNELKLRLNTKIVFFFWTKLRFFKNRFSTRWKTRQAIAPTSHVSGPATTGGGGRACTALHCQRGPKDQPLWHEQEQELELAERCPCSFPELRCVRTYRLAPKSVDNSDDDNDDGDDDDVNISNNDR